MSAYVIEQTDNHVDKEKINASLPKQQQLKDGRTCSIELFDPESTHAQQDYDSLLKCFNHEVETGTYPQDYVHSLDQFKAYYFSHSVFVARCATTHSVLGSFYVKPNFPGRCSHICNAGFLVTMENRGIGVGTILANAFLVAAPQLNYKASFFNLVFEDNPASIKLWNNLGFQVTGRVPSAKQQKDGSFVNALMYYKEFSA